MGWSQDSLFAEMRQQRLVLLHPLRPTETLADLARHYGVSVQELQESDSLETGRVIEVEIRRQDLVDSNAGRTPVYLRCTGEENLSRLSEMLNATVPVLPPDSTTLALLCKENRGVLIGYLRVPDSGRMMDSIRQERSDSVLTPTETAEQLFETQQAAGAPLKQETGPVAFFASAAPQQTYYVLHPTAARGTMVRLRNPANGQVIYAKVLGVLPRTRIYGRAIAAVSQNARQALGSLGDARLRCEVVYPAGDF